MFTQKEGSTSLTPEERKEGIEFLKKQRLDDIKQWLLNEVNHRSTLQLQLAHPKDDKLNAAHVQTGQVKEGLEVKIKHNRAVERELAGGDLTV